MLYFRQLYKNGHSILFFIILIINEVFVTSLNFKCHTNVKCIIKRSSRNNGFHKDLLTEIHLVPSFPYQLPVGPYEFLVKEFFPSSVYVDPYQVALLKHFKGPDVSIISFVNVELPAYKSEELNVFVYFASRYSRSKLKLPIHLRYMQPQNCYSNGSYIDIQIANPLLAVKTSNLYCPNSFLAPCNSSSHKNCTWLVLPSSSEFSSLNLKVPVGCVEHFSIVCILMIVIIVIGIVVVIYSSSQKMKRVQFKEN